MSSDKSKPASTSRFYANELCVEEFEFTIVEDSNPLPSLVPAIERVAKSLMSCVAALAVSGTITLRSADFRNADLSSPDRTVVYEPGEEVGAGREAPDIQLMTARMLERAKLARVFSRTPHPGEDESDPDHGF